MANNKGVKTPNWKMPKPSRFEKDLAALKKVGSKKIAKVLAAAIIKETAARAAVEKRMRDAGYDLEGDESYMLMDGHDNAFIGMVEQFGKQARACYDLDKVIANLVKDFLKTAREEEPSMEAARERAEEMAWEWYGCNMLGSWVGEGTPVFLRRM